jgi:predicted glycogen debranching enzyme
MASTQQSFDIAASRPNARQESAAAEFGREVCGSLEIAEQREWLVTNGIGGFASGTVSGNMTRRYHGLLFAALKPPVGRTLLVASVEETVRYHGGDYPLATNRWVGGAVAPSGYRYLEVFPGGNRTGLAFCHYNA